MPGAPPEVPGLTGLTVIGRGGYGVVYRGHQGDFGRDVAVKVLSAPGADERAVERWRREITAMGRLSNHPNIVAVYSAGVTEAGHPYLIMPFVSGGSLHDRLASGGPLPGESAALVGSKLAAGLAAAHAAGVLHRDVKPANVLMSEYGEPQLTDFGIARLVDSATTTTGSVQATIGYAPPEVLSGDGATPASDVYGLGATLHAALSGEAPFAGPDDEPLTARIGRVMTQMPPDLRALGVAPGLAAVIESTLAKDPADRPQSASELQERLDAADLADGGGAAAAAAPPPTEQMGAAALAAAPVVVPGPREPETSVSPVVPAVAAAPSAGSPPGSGRPWLIGAGALAALVVVGLLAWWLLGSRGDDGGERTATDGTATSSTTEDPASSSSAPPETGGSEPATTPSSEPASTPSSEPATTASSEPATTASTEPVTTAPSTTTAPPDDDDEGPSEDDVSGALNQYYSTVDGGDLRASYDLLSSDYQAQQPFGRYQGFWNGIDSVSVQGPAQVDLDSLTAAVTLRYVLADGSESVEDVQLGFIEGDDGSLLINSYETR